MEAWPALCFVWGYCAGPPSEMVVARTADGTVDLGREVWSMGDSNLGLSLVAVAS